MGFALAVVEVNAENDIIVCQDVYFEGNLKNKQTTYVFCVLWQQGEQPYLIHHQS